MRTYNKTENHLDAHLVRQAVVQEGCNLLEQDNIYDLSEQKPGIVFEGQVLVFLRKNASGGSG